MGLLKKMQDHFDDYYRKKWALTENNWDHFTSKIFPMAVEKGLSNLNHPIYGPILRRLFRFVGKNHHAEACVVPISKELNFKAGDNNFVMPIQKIREAIDESSYRIIMHRCICRDSFNCENFPIDFACLMLGEACRTMVENGIARPATKEESLTHLDRASELGLVAICAWTEMESIAKGIPVENKLKYFEICFCCPCCCNGLVSFKKWYEVPELRKLFKPTGWRAKLNGDCTGCGICSKICPMDAITVKDDKTVTTDVSCLGCGLCASRCPQKALVMEEYEPMKERILDYLGDDIRPQING